MLRTLRADAPYLGMACPFTGIAWLLMSNELVAHEHVGVRSPYISMVVLCLFVLLARLTVPERHRAADEKSGACDTRVDRMFTLCYMASALLIAACDAAHGAWLPFTAAMLLGGAAIGWQYIRWGIELSHLDARASITVICACVVFAAGFKAALRLSAAVSMPAASTLAACVGAAGQACLERCGGHPRAEDSAARREEPDIVRSCWKSITALVVLCATIGFVYNTRGDTGSVGTAYTLAGYLVETLGAIAVAWWVGGLHRSLSATGILAFVGLLLASGLVLIACTGNTTGGFAFLVTNADHSLLTLLLWAVLVDIARSYEVDRSSVFAVGWALRSASFFLGGVAAREHAAVLDQGTCLILVYAVLVALVLVLSDRSVAANGVFIELADRVDGVLADLDGRCAELGQRAGLTPRETEVMALLCRGRSRPFIAEQLVVSENTVRAHTKGIYRKLGIHSRQELLDLVESEAGGASSGAAD